MFIQEEIQISETKIVIILSNSHLPEPVIGFLNQTVICFELLRVRKVKIVETETKIVKILSNSHVQEPVIGFLNQKEPIILRKFYNYRYRT